MKKLLVKYNICLMFFVVLVFAGTCQAQTMYKCGNSFSQQPCAPDAKPMPIPPPGNCTDEHMRFSQYCRDQEVKKERVLSQRHERELMERKERADRDLAFKSQESAKAVEEYKQQLSKQSKASQQQIDEKNKRPDVSATQIELNKTKCLSEIKGTLKDPESAQFSEVKRRKPGTDYLIAPVSPSVWYTVLVNAKNSFGAFSGRKQQICAFDLDENKMLYKREVDNFLD